MSEPEWDSEDEDAAEAFIRHYSLKIFRYEARMAYFTTLLEGIVPSEMWSRRLAWEIEVETLEEQIGLLKETRRAALLKQAGANVRIPEEAAQPQQQQQQQIVEQQIVERQIVEQQFEQEDSDDSWLSALRS